MLEIIQHINEKMLFDPDPRKIVSYKLTLE